MSEWYYAQNGERFGPVSFEELKTLIEGGRVEGRNLIWRVGWSDWERAVRFEELASEAVVAEGNETPPPLPKRRDEGAKALKSNMPVIVAMITGTLFLMCLGCCGVGSFFSSREQARRDAEQEVRERESAEKAKKELAAADMLWENGERKEAVKQYVKLGDSVNKFDSVVIDRLSERLDKFASEELSKAESDWASGRFDSAIATYNDLENIKQIAQAKRDLIATRVKQHHAQIEQRQSQVGPIRFELLESFPERYKSKFITLKSVGLGSVDKNSDGYFYLRFHSEFPTDGSVVLSSKIGRVSAVVDASTAEKLIQEGLKNGIVHQADLYAKVDTEGDHTVLKVYRVDFYNSLGMVIKSIR